MRLPILMLLTFLFIFTLVKAQQPKVFAIPGDRFKDTVLLDKLKDKDFVDSLRNELRKRYAPYNKMQLAGSMPRRLNYIGNNQQGFDIYQTPYYNMYILKPDSTFASNMPVANTYNLTMKPVEMPNPKKDRRE
jgi:hypothetical protein